MRSKSIAGILGLAGAALFAAAAVVSILMFQNGTYSPMNCYVTELGLYTGGFMEFSSAFVFNIGLILFGLTAGMFMVINGLRSEAPLNTAASFFGVLSGVLMIAQGLFSLNYYTFHYVLASAFFVSVFMMCVLYIVSRMLSGDVKSAPAGAAAAFLTGIASALSAGYMITGGMAQVFAQDAANIGRANVIPFAVTGWITYVLLIVFIVVLSIRMFADKEKTTKPRPASSPAGSGDAKPPARKRSAKAPAHTYR